MDNMEEQLVGLSNNDATHIAKGKRTKRMRLLSPCGVAAAAATTVMTSSCSSASGCDYGSFSSYESTDQEEEDMANCLILLAQGGGGGGDSNHHHHHHKQLDEDHDHDGNKMDQKGSTKIAITATNSNTKAGFFIYECKTCNRTFPSFQALGGHRASHKKPKVNMVEEKKPQIPQPPSPPPPSSQPRVITNHDIQFEEAGQQTHIKSGPPISLQLGGSHSHKASSFHGNKAKIHECSICGSEFTSGQALGGHMRRHRASTNTTTITATTTAVAVQPRNILQLDLNLPAPEDDLREPKFQFTATQNSMVLSAAPALVDCHY